MSTKDFLAELGTEELPPKALPKLSQAFASGIETGLKELGLRFGEIEVFATPRRLAVRVNALSDFQPDSIVEKVGPAVKAAFDKEGLPTKAASGFARSCGVEVSQLSTTLKDGTEKLFYSKNEPGAETVSLLPAIVQKSLDKLPIPKRMRWGSSRIEFVRPVHWCVLLFGKSFIDTTILGVKSGAVTYGHRFHHSASLAIATPSGYEDLLENRGFVIADFSKRKEIIREQVLEIAKSRQGTAVIDENLLDEVTGLVEFPVALSGEFDKEFLEVPPEALILAMKSHQKYFHLVDESGNLMPCFISVSNIKSSDPSQVVAGNEKVIRPRLADARFFYESDLKTPLAAKIEKLKTIIFQAQLGTVYDKSERVSRLAVYMADQFDGDIPSCKRAASLAKCDLLTDMVGEFADLQGLMGYYYALKDGESNEVASAIVEQYLPRYAGDALPKTLTGNIVSLAEKIDTIAGLFAIKQPPTGSKDPFAIRRAALGVLRILVENRLELDILKVLGFALEGFANLDIEEGTDQVIFEFMLDRLRAWYQDKDIPIEVFQSVRAFKPRSPFDFDKRISAVHHFGGLEQAQALASANKRVSNLVVKSGLKDSNSKVDPSLFDSEAERVLYSLVEGKEVELAPLIKNHDYSGALVSLSTLREPIDNFFDDVMVMSDVEAVKVNRIMLLMRLRDLFLQVADVSLLHSN